MNLVEYRNAPLEKQRVADLMALVPAGLASALDIGARDGHLSCLLADRIHSVTALDLETPQINDQRLKCVKGDATALAFADNSFDLVFCAEVLEHIPTPMLARACSEMQRVCARHLVIGVPYRQDIRHGQTTCAACGRLNPPWGHVNSFDERRLQALFSACITVETTFVGCTREATNGLSSALMSWAGNPYGTYSQEEPCIHCGRALGQPRVRSLGQRIATKLGAALQAAQERVTPARGNWIHVHLEKR